MPSPCTACLGLSPIPELPPTAPCPKHNWCGCVPSQCCSFPSVSAVMMLSEWKALCWMRSIVLFLSESSFCPALMVLYAKRTQVKVYSIILLYLFCMLFSLVIYF